MYFNPLQFYPYWCWNHPIFGQWRLSNWLLNPFGMTPVVFESFHTLWYDKLFQAHLIYFPPKTLTQWFLQRHLVPFSRKWSFETTIWRWGELIGIGLVSISRFFPRRQKIHSEFILMVPIHNQDYRVFTWTSILCPILFLPHWESWFSLTLGMTEL